MFVQDTSQLCDFVGTDTECLASSESTEDAVLSPEHIDIAIAEDAWLQEVHHVPGISGCPDREVSRECIPTGCPVAHVPEGTGPLAVVPEAGCLVHEHRPPLPGPQCVGNLRIGESFVAQDIDVARSTLEHSSPRSDSELRVEGHNVLPPPLLPEPCLYLLDRLLHEGVGNTQQDGDISYGDEDL